MEAVPEIHFSDFSYMSTAVVQLMLAEVEYCIHSYSTVQYSTIPYRGWKYNECTV